MLASMSVFGLVFRLNIPKSLASRHSSISTPALLKTCSGTLLHINTSTPNVS